MPGSTDGAAAADAPLPGFGGALERFIFGRRSLILVLFALGTLVLGTVAR